MNFTKRIMAASSISILLSSLLLANEAYTIENSSLQEAIKQISKGANMTYMVDGRLLEGKKAPDIKNIQGVQNALNAVLKGTNLEAIIKDNTIIIRKKESGVKTNNDMGTLDVLSGTSHNSSALNLYDEASTASKLGVTIKEIPASVEVINADAMKLRGDNTVMKAIEKTAGMTASADPGTPMQFSVRGFSTNSVNLLYNGTKIPGGTNMSNRPMDSANLDRIEIIRGAASVLHGEGSIGASVNLITKQPSFKEQDIELDYSIGSFNNHRFHFGNGGALIDDTLAYRFDYSRSQGESNIDDEETKMEALSFALLYKIQDNLFATVSIEKTDDETDNVYHGTPLVDGKLSESLREKNYNKLEDGLFQSDNLWLRANIDWYVSPELEVKNQTYYYDSTRDWRTIAKFTYNASTNMIDRDWFNDMDHEHTMVGDRLDLLYKSPLFGLDNRFLVGTDISKTDFKTKRPQFIGSDSVDVDNPGSVYYSDVTDDYKKSARDIDINQIAVYMEDQLSLTESLKLVAGLRYDIIDTDWQYLDRAGDPTFSKEHKAWSYRLGTVYDVTDATTLYATYTTAIEPGGTFLLLTPEQTQLDLTEAEQFELGIKQSFWDNKGEFTGAVYQIKKKNIFVPDPDNPSSQINAGEQSSKGIELGIGLKPTEQWAINANVAAVDAEFDKYYTGSGANKVSYNGNQPSFVPKYVANLGIRYMPTSKIGINTWVRHVDSVYADDANTMKLPSYTTVDLSLNYLWNQKTNIGFMIRNLTDEFYATRVRSGTSAIIADPRTYELSLSFKF